MSERRSAMDTAMKNWEFAVEEIKNGRPLLSVFLILSREDISNAARTIDCPYCRQHMLLEADEVGRVIKRLDSEGNRGHAHGGGERLGALFRSVKIVVNILLGALRRAGVV